MDEKDVIIARQQEVIDQQGQRIAALESVMALAALQQSNLWDTYWDQAA